MDEQKPGQTISPQTSDSGRSASPTPELKVSWDPTVVENVAPETASQPVVVSVVENNSPATAATQTQTAAVTPAAPVVSAAPTLVPESPVEAATQGPAPITAASDATPWQFKQESVAPAISETLGVNQDQAPPPTNVANIEPITWSASEFIAHKKSNAWYVMLIVAAVVLAGLAFLVTHSYFSAAIILLVAITFAFFAEHQPRVMNYKLDGGGLSIGQKFYDYDMFKAFAVVSEGAFSSILLMPLKRFMPPLSLYYAPDDEARIMDALKDRLPVENHQPDAVESLMRRIRF